MNRINMNIQSQQLAEQVLMNQGLESEYFAEVKICTNIGQVFEAISGKDAEHFAVLSPNDEPIRNILGYIKDQLSQGREVSVALFYKKADQEQWGLASSN